MRGFFTRLIALGIAAPLGLPGQNGSADPAFAGIPFEQWLTQQDQARMRWAIHLSDPELSAHQRLAVNLEIDIDGAELARRRSQGQFLVLVQLTDGNNCRWQNHQEIDLDRLPDTVKAGDAVLTQRFFIVPGDYHVAVALLDTASGEHSVMKHNLHISALRNDPLPRMWEGLPAVEFLVPGTEESSSDRWYLPSIEGRLRLPVETRHPIDVDLVVNLTPPEQLAASADAQNRDLDALIPAVKVLSQVEWANARFNLELLDIGRRRVAYRQENMQALDWSKARTALDQANPATIDVRSLRNRRYSADFFVNRILRNIGPSNQSGTNPRVVIVLSSSVFFQPGVEMRPVAIAPRPDLKVIYIRYQPLMPVFYNREGEAHRRYFITGGDDELAPLLKSLSPTVFHVATPEQFRKTLAAVLSEIGRL